MTFEEKLLFQQTLSSAMETILDEVDSNSNYKNIASYDGFEFMFFLRSYFYQYYTEHESDFDFTFDDFFAEFDIENSPEDDIYDGCEILEKMAKSGDEYDHLSLEGCRNILRNELASQSKNKPDVNGLIESVLLLNSRIVGLEYKLEREIEEIKRNYQERREEW